MASDIRFNDESVIVEGSLGVGTDSPQRPVHIETGEIHTGGPFGGLSFADRLKPGLTGAPSNGERWVWYASAGRARLWSGADAVSVRRDTSSGFVTEIAGALKANEVVADKLVFSNAQIDGPLKAGEVTATKLVSASAQINGSLKAGDVTAERLKGVVTIGPLGGIDSVVCSSRALTLNDPAAPTTIPTETELTTRPPARAPGSDQPVPFPLPNTPIPPRIALFHDFGPNADRLVINHQRRYVGGVRVDGNLHVDGVVTEASSITLKDDVSTLSPVAAMAALGELSPVTYHYKADERQVQHVGFIAEDVPDLVAQPGRDRLRSMDIVAVLTAVVKEQQRAIAELAGQIAVLKRPETTS